jgi:hypothetical protein
MDDEELGGNAESSYMDKTMQELQSGRQALNQQYEKMKAALSARTQLPFDPALMKMAAGFLQPTKTGSFGESLGYATSGYTEEAEKELARQQATQKLQLEIEQKMYEMRKNAAMQNYMMGLSGGEPTAKPTTLVKVGEGGEEGGMMPTGAPAAPTTAVPTAGTGAAPYEKIITPQDVTRAYALDESGKLGDRLAKIAKLQADNVVVTEKGTYNKATGKFAYTDAQLNSVSDYDFPYIGTKKVPLKAQLEFDAMKEKGDSEGMMNFFRKNFPEDVRGGAAGATTETMGEGLRTPTQKKVEEEERIAGAKETGKAGAEKATSLANRAESAMPNREAADDLIAYATTNPRIFGLLQQPGIAGAVSRAAEEGIRTGNFSISLPASTLATYNLSKDELNALQMAAQASMRLQVQFRRMERIAGEGAMSDLETKMFAALAPQMNDSPTVIRLKSELLKKRSDFDENLYDKWIEFSESTGKSYQKFMTSDTYKSEVGKYRKVLKEIRDQNVDLFSRRGQPAAQPSTQQSAPGTTTEPSSGPSGRNLLDALRRRHGNP